jgi:hypothetical protein
VNVKEKFKDYLQENYPGSSFPVTCKFCRHIGQKVWHCHCKDSPQYGLNVWSTYVCDQFQPNEGLMMYLYYMTDEEGAKSRRELKAKIEKELQPEQPEKCPLCSIERKVIQSDIDLSFYYVHPEPLCNKAIKMYEPTKGMHPCPGNCGTRVSGKLYCNDCEIINKMKEGG